MKIFSQFSKNVALVIVALFLLSTPLIVSHTSGIAYAQNNDGGAKSATNDPGVKGVKTSGDSFKLNIKFSNPLKVDTIQDAIKLFVNGIVRIAIPIIVIFFLWSGLSFVLALGNPTKIEKAKNTFFYTVIGTLLILGAWTITNAIIGTVNSITK